MNINKMIQTQNQKIVTAISSIAQIEINLKDKKAEIANDEIEMTKQEGYERAKTELERQRQLENYTPTRFKEQRNLERELINWNGQLDIAKQEGYMVDRLLKLMELLPEHQRFDFVSEE